MSLSPYQDDQYRKVNYWRCNCWLRVRVTCTSYFLPYQQCVFSLICYQLNVAHWSDYSKFPSARNVQNRKSEVLNSLCRQMCVITRDSEAIFKLIMFPQLDVLHDHWVLDEARGICFSQTWADLSVCLVPCHKSCIASKTLSLYCQMNGMDIVHYPTEYWYFVSGEEKR